ncbi:MAG: NAD(P)-binding protein [Rhodococcus sp. (in: high G+C Gram-positive bacteria)]|nr:NAD(P)-binding protein [Rhodococcus sp. (in: high G+C Gram-positive bacteria)]
MNSETGTITDPVTIVGAGIAGAACARVLRDADVPFRIVDRGRAPGGRMSSPELHGRRVDLGAGYFTVRDQEFSTVVAEWESGGLARQWANTFGILKPDTAPCTTTGPVRWATPNGLRSLVRNMLDGVDIQHPTELTDLPDGHVVVAMPDPQATRLTAVPDAVDYVPVIAVACGFDGLDLPFRDAAFVNDHPDIDFVVDDGARRGDGAPVLVVHTTSERAQQHLDFPDGAIAPVLDALRELSVVTGGTRRGLTLIGGPSPSLRRNTIPTSRCTSRTDASSVWRAISGANPECPGWRARGVREPMWAENWLDASRTDVCPASAHEPD